MGEHHYTQPWNQGENPQHHKRVCTHAIRYGWMATNPIRTPECKPTTHPHLFEGRVASKALRRTRTARTDSRSSRCSHRNEKGEVLATKWGGYQLEKKTLHIQKSSWQQHDTPRQQQHHDEYLHSRNQQQEAERAEQSKNDSAGARTSAASAGALNMYFLVYRADFPKVV
jgi:hypothetical protein